MFLNFVLMFVVNVVDVIKVVVVIEV